MASIERRGDGWRVRWRGIDGRPRGRQCPSKRTAQDLAREVEDCIARGRDWTAAVPVAVELHDVAQAFLDDSRRYLAESSRSDRRYALEAWMRWAAVRYPRRPMDALSRDGVAAYHAHLLGPHDGRRGLTDGSALLTVQAILRLWRWASESDRFADVVGPVRKPHLRQPAQRIRRGAPTWTDIDRVIDASAGLEWLRRAVWVARCTGLRVSQVRAMQWADVDLEASTLRVTTGKSRRERAGRVVPLAPVLVAEMARWGRREGAVAPGMADSAHAARIKARWRAVDMPEDRRAAALAQPWHSIRRAFVSELAARGVPPEIRAALVGHALGITSDVYTTAASVWPAMVEAVALVTAPTSAAASFETRRVRSVSSSDTRTAQVTEKIG